MLSTQEHRKARVSVTKVFLPKLSAHFSVSVTTEPESVLLESFISPQHKSVKFPARGKKSRIAKHL